MKDTVRPLGVLLSNTDTDIFSRVPAEIIRYYSEAGMDYEPWSQKYNMHFGYYSRGVNPFSREDLLDEMNRQVLSRLKMDDSSLFQLLDLGCGVGATARYCVSNIDNTMVTGATVVPWQIEKATELTRLGDLDQKVCYRLIDYRDTPFPDNSFDGAYAVESSCYDEGLDKRSFINEAFRVLKPGARLVVADGFRKVEKGSWIFEKAIEKVCEGWSLETFANIDDFVEAMESAGFEDIAVEEISWRVAPSVMYVPWVSFKYYLGSIFFGDGENSVKKMHLMAPLMGLVVGLHRSFFGYHMVSAKKPEVDNG